jgi:tetrahydromethanopterin S-methyltransferase subunit A
MNVMENKYYPWGGEFTTCKDTGCVAVVLLNTEYAPPDTVAIYGPLKTENIGIEKIVANTISNPYIRYIIITGEEIRGHRSGKSLLALSKNGIDKNHRIINAPGAIPYIENIDEKAIKRFQEQIQIIDMIGEKDTSKIDKKIKECINKSPPSFGKSYIAIRITPKIATLDDKRALHSKIIIDYMGKIKKRGK